VEFRLLGLLEVVTADGPVQIVRGRESALLALLLLHRNEPLSSDRIVEELWGEAASQHAAQSVRIYISRLRKSVGAGRIETTGGGYLIRTAEDELDAATFERLAAAGAAALSDGEAERTASLLGEALGLWRGDALAEFRFDSFAQQAIRRLEALRTGARADLVDALLALGRARDVVPELEALIEQSPLSERPRGQLMRALYLSGRQADALALFRTTRTLLADELGVDPGPELQQLERAILTQDPALGRPVAAPIVAAHRRRLRLLLAGVALVIAAAGAVVFLLERSSQASLRAVPSNSIALLDPRTNQIVAEVPVGTSPGAIASGFGGVWVVNGGDNTLSRIDAKTRVVHTVSLPGAPAGLAVGAGAVWVVSAVDAENGFAAPDAQLSRVDPSYPDLVQTQPTGLPFDPTQEPVAVGGGAVWTGAPASNAPLLRIDAQTATVSRRIRLNGVLALAADSNNVWAFAFDTGALERIDPRQGAISETIPIPPGAFEPPPAITLGSGAVWVASAFRVYCPPKVPAGRWPDKPGTVYRVDPETSALTPIAVGREPVAIGAGNSAIWVANRGSDSISRIDPKTNTVVATIKLHNRPQGITYANNTLWVSVD
jgi:YVTN family beta-propeller protein